MNQGRTAQRVEQNNQLIGISLFGFGVFMALMLVMQYLYPIAPTA